jgi:hypothetical protein
MPSGIFVFIAQPTPNATVRRNITVSGSFSRFKGSILSAAIQFGAGGPVFALQSGVFSFFWSGNIPNNIRPGQAFQIIVTASGLMDGPEIVPGEPGESIEVGGQAIQNVVLENVVPVVTLNPFRSPVAIKQSPQVFTLSGTASEPGGAPYGVQQVQFQVGSGPLILAMNPSGNWSQWSANLLLPPGDHAITVRATDPFGSVTTVQRTLSVLLYPMPAVIPPDAKKTAQGVPTTSSVTSWTRLEPQVAGADIGASTNARLFDPLWLMTRQWQMGEFQGEDAGTPIQARVRATNATLTRCRVGELSANSTAPRYDPARAPLEAIVERRRMRATDAKDTRMLALAVEAGLHFLRMVELNVTANKYRPAFLATYALQPLSEQAAAVTDAPTVRLVQTTAGRAPDARLLATAFRTSGSTAIVFDPALKVAPADVAAVGLVATNWLAWYDALFAEPATSADDAWTPSRLEYAVSVATRLSAAPQDGLTLSANEFDGGQLDWSSFDLDGKFSIDTTGDQPFTPLNETTMPSPVTIRGTPAPRFWEMEDAKVAYGLMPVGPTDLAHLLMIEYASSYGNDWFVVPLTVPVGSVTRVSSLVVTDTFGVRSLLRPIGDPGLPAPHFSMWQPSTRRYAGDVLGTPVSNTFFLPPTIARSVDGAPLEDVLFMRDEMANMAWGIERVIEGGAEAAVALPNGSQPVAAAPAAAASGTLPRYLLSTTVPDNWIPLLPEQLTKPDDSGKLVQRLRRGAVLHPDATSRPQTARSEALNAGASLLLYDEEVPREGVHITRRRRLVRWMDGSMWVWTAFRNEVGSGEGSAGLRFDQVEGDGPANGGGLG